ncbi:GNAT family N-acetyltransferase [Parasedimentitalea maritima]|uniref:GNAT family N-acetyltransferase n=2 Tax=Parasedimentitalea TaxID=2738399 RepID=A0A6L6WIG1_9RHOB|nr:MULTISPECIES: GNAT family N-acetyltransferase [Zongyanglinia]MVO15512.1 GNAT family N-acetyltransferase [Zongyanglinia huanghaiensis]TLP68784.1 GNAT family N-acetyltransferase [Zongyanglinia marina]
MTLSLTLILPRERAQLAAALAPYFFEIAPTAPMNPDDRAEQVLHRKDVTAFWINNGGSRIGFAIVLNLPEDRRELSEFAIFPKHRRQGLGYQAAQILLQEFPGRWRMGLSAHSKQAAAFWGTCLSGMPGVRDLREGAPFSKHQIKSYTFDIAGPNND